MRMPVLRTLGSLCAVLGLAGALASPAGAAPTVLKARVICDTDGAAPFTDVIGSVQIKDDGEVRVKVKGLLPDTPYTCLLNCIEGAAAAECTTDRKGTMNAKLPGLGRSGDLENGCQQPVFTMFADDPDDDGDFCSTGYGAD